MCNFKSFLILKPESDGVRPKLLHAHGIDSHEALIEKFNVRERKSASAQDQPFARVECEPQWDKDVRTDAGWAFKLDESRTPDWWNDCAEVAEQECKRICKALVCDSGAEYSDADFILLAGTAIAKGSSRCWAWGSSRVVARGSSRVEAWGSSSVVARESSSVVAWGSSSVVARESSRVVARGSSRVEAWESSRVVARESSSVVAWGSSSVENSSPYAICARRQCWDGSGYPFEIIPVSNPKSESSK